MSHIAGSSAADARAPFAAHIRFCLTRVPTLQKAVAWWGRQVRAEAWAVASKMLVRVRDGQGLMVSDHFGLGADLTLLAQ